jgi:hypothetical protein
MRGLYQLADWEKNTSRQCGPSAHSLGFVLKIQGGEETARIGAIRPFDATPALPANRRRAHVPGGPPL